MSTIYFYSTLEKPYGVFSNFYKSPIVIEGITWKTTEHYFQAAKFFNTDPDWAIEIAKVKTAKEAAKMGRSREHPIDPNWESIKDNIMLEALRAKFTQHSDLKQVLLSTGDSEIVEKTTHDYYWGCGTNKTGLNMLGKLLVKVRSELNGDNNLTSDNSVLF